MFLFLSGVPVQHNGGFLPGIMLLTHRRVTTIGEGTYLNLMRFLKKNQNAPMHRPSEHPPVRGENVKTFRWDHRLLRRSRCVQIFL